MPSFAASNSHIAIRRPGPSDRVEFLALVHASVNLHHPWVQPPSNPEQFDAYLQSRKDPLNDGFLICRPTSGAIVGLINLNCIVRGFFQSAYLGYYGHAAYAGQGLMTHGLKLVIQYAFTQLGLHRLEANIQPQNTASIALARRCGFQKEGFSPKYLKILGQWRDHERFALLADSAMPPPDNST
jgi:[ribosomal protein S5]-alanine N-acetyltransferase